VKEDYSMVMCMDKQTELNELEMFYYYCVYQELLKTIRRFRASTFVIYVDYGIQCYLFFNR